MERQNGFWPRQDFCFFGNCHAELVSASPATLEAVAKKLIAVVFKISQYKGDAETSSA
ncbi:hypothetical protein [Paracnuella aquatica]|uniref:hypothetical protein n=1 Tax=Paracnuella aquatica TaxID=2268757 RepID=UPI0012D75E5D|nr:hypothetical protein [Paracnuella aquatica]